MDERLFRRAKAGSAVCTTGLLCALLSAGSPARGDWEGFSRYGETVELAVEASEIRIDLRLMESAALAGIRLPADLPASPPAWLAGRLPPILGRNGKPLVGRLRFLNRMDAEAAGSAGGGGKESYYEAGLSYRLAQAPESLLIAPPAIADKGIGLVALHRGVPVCDLAPLVKPVRLTLNWSDPWRSGFDDAQFVRRHAEPRSYVYVEPYAVRHEALLRLSELKPFMDLGLKDRRFVEQGEREAVKQKIGALLLSRNPLRIDGLTPAPQLGRVEFVRFDRFGVAPLVESGRLDTNTALVGVILTYPSEAPARLIQLRWDLFAGDFGQRQISLNQGEESFDGYVTPQHPWFEWSRDDALELASSAHTDGGNAPIRPGAGANDAGVEVLLQSLLHNAYAAFQVRDEEKAYDRLAKSLDGDLLDETYLQQRRAILQQSRGLGGGGAVERVEVLDFQTEAAEADAWRVSVRWIAHGTVSHWGHSHMRHNLYQARLSLRAAAGGEWKIFGMEFQGGQRLAPGAS